MPTMPDRILITGVSRAEGLGFETARQLIDQGHELLISGRDLADVQPLADRIGAQAYQLDITNEASVFQLAAQLRSEFGALDVLINNAGAFFDMGGEPLAAEMKTVQAALDTNLLGAWRMIQAMMPLLRASEHPRIVNVSSGAGSFSDPQFGLPVHQGKVPVYGITKLALNGLTVKMARQLSPMGIKINSVCPGFVATYPGTEQWGARPVADGAKGIVWGATIGKEGPTGGFFRDGEPLAW